MSEAYFDANQETYFEANLGAGAWARWWGGEYITVFEPSLPAGEREDVINVWDTAAGESRYPFSRVGFYFALVHAGRRVPIDQIKRIEEGPITVRLKAHDGSRLILTEDAGTVRFELDGEIVLDTTDYSFTGDSLEELTFWALALDAGGDYGADNPCMTLSPAMRDELTIAHMTYAGDLPEGEGEAA